MSALGVVRGCTGTRSTGRARVPGPSHYFVSFHAQASWLPCRPLSSHCPTLSRSSGPVVRPLHPLHPLPHLPCACSRSPTNQLVTPYDRPFAGVCRPLHHVNIHKRTPRQDGRGHRQPTATPSSPARHPRAVSPAPDVPLLEESTSRTTAGSPPRSSAT
jgi:hypothetical protein